MRNWNSWPGQPRIKHFFHAFVCLSIHKYINNGDSLTLERRWNVLSLCERLTLLYVISDKLINKGCSNFSFLESMKVPSSKISAKNLNEFGRKVSWCSVEKDPSNALQSLPKIYFRKTMVVLHNMKVLSS